MTEAPPRMGFGPGPIMLPAVSWFEFVLDDKLLEAHLSKENPEPTAPQLIVEFLQQAETQIAGGIKEPQATPAAQSQGNNETGQETVPSLPITESKKMKALKILALKVAAYSNWNYNVFGKNVPLSMMHMLLNEFLHITVGQNTDIPRKSPMDVSLLPDEAVFALQLYHRWCLQAVIKHSFPKRPARGYLLQTPTPPPDSQTSGSGNNVNFQKTLMDQTPNSVDNLLRCIQYGRNIRMPTAESLGTWSEHVDTIQYKWEHGTAISSQEVACQIAFDLGSFYFYQEAYSKAFEMFRKVTDLQKTITAPIYCKIDKSRLHGYLSACSSLQDVPLEGHKQSLYEQTERSKRRNYKDLLDLLIQDNLKQELPIGYRMSLEEDIRAGPQGTTALYFHVCLSNVVRRVLEGRAVLTDFSDTLDSADQNTIEYVLKVFRHAMRGSSFSQRSNLKCFILHTLQMTSKQSPFTVALLDSDLKLYFEDSDDDMEVLSLDDEDTTFRDLSFDYSPPTFKDNSNLNLGSLERQLLCAYEPDVIRDLVNDLCRKWGRSPSQVIGLNDKWIIPKEIRHILEARPPSIDTIYTHVLIGKARHCMQLRIYDRARQLLYVADNVMKDHSYVMSKHLRWLVLLSDLLQFYLNETFSEDTSQQDLIKKTKTCLTSVRLAQDVQPSSDVLEHCTSFLLNIRDWDYLHNMENTRNGYIEISRVTANLCKELTISKNVGSLAREFWEAIVQIFTTVPPRRPNSGRVSGLGQDHQIKSLSNDGFIQWIQKVKEPVALGILISALTKLYNLIKDDISSEISSDYIMLWPSALTSISSLNVTAVTDTVGVMLQHALEVNSNLPSWLKTQADIYFAHGQFAPAMKFYLEAGVVSSDFFSEPVSNAIYNEKVYKRMIKACSNLQCHTQVAVLCQFLDEVDYATACTSLQERNTYDAMDMYYGSIWDISLLEYLVHLHTKRGEMDKRQAAMKAMSQLDINSNNPEEILSQAVAVRKRHFLRAMAKQYL